MKYINNYKKVIVLIILFISVMFFFKKSFGLDKIVLDFSYSSGPCNKQLYEAFNNILDGNAIGICSIEVSQSEIEKIETLNLSNSQLSSISTGQNIFKYFVNLKELNLSNNQISSVNPIVNANISLEILNLSNNNLSDVDSEGSITSKLSSIKSLQELDLSHNKLKYLTGINGLTNLKKLNMYNNMLVSLTGIEGLEELEYLNLGENYTGDIIENLDSLKLLPNIKYFNFSENKTPSILNYVVFMTNIEELNLETNKIININEDVKNLVNLKSINLYNNKISVIENLLPLANVLEELILQNNSLENADILLQMTDLKKLDIAYNDKLGNAYDDENPNSATLKILINNFDNTTKELNYEYITDTSNFTGREYITYEDFGARCNGVYDDFIAIRNAHIYANKKNIDVKAISNGLCKNGQYHIFKYYEKESLIKTNVDWNNATFIVHDEEINYKSGKYKGIFKVSNVEEIIKFEHPSLTIKKDTVNINNFVQNNLSLLNEKGYKKYLFIVKNSNVKQYIRTGSNKNSGNDQKEYFLVDSDGNILNDIQFNFDEITNLEVYALPDDEIKIENANFIVNSIITHGENINGKEYYFARNILIEDAVNIYVSNIHHSLSNDDISGNYNGFIYFHNDVNIDAKDLYLHAFKRQMESTYSLNLNGIVNAKFVNVHINPSDDSINDKERFGMIGANYLKDISFEKCVMNRIDTHKGVYNLNVSDSIIGYGAINVIGAGILNVYNTKVYADSFINLRWDYGATFDGTVNILNSTFVYTGESIPAIIRGYVQYDNDKSIHNYGYECKLPNLYMTNITIDLNNRTLSNVYLYNLLNMYNFSNTDDVYKNNTLNYLETYLPTIVKIKNYSLVNGEGNIVSFDENTISYLEELKKNIDITIIDNLPTPKVTLMDKTTEYTGNEISIDDALVELSNDNIYNGDINYNYYVGDNCNGHVINYIPITSGIYSVKAIVEENEEHSSAESNCAKLTINKKNPLLTLEKETMILGNTSKNLHYTYDGDGTISCSSSNASITCNIDIENKLIKIIKESDSNGIITVMANVGTNYNSINKTINIINEEISIKDENKMSFIDGNIIVKIPYNKVLTYQDVMDGISVISEKIEIYNSQNIIINSRDEIIGTDSKIVLANIYYPIIVNGDINADGKITALDYIAIRNHMMATNIISDDKRYMAGDMNKDKKITALDYIAIRKIMLNEN